MVEVRGHVKRRRGTSAGRAFRDVICRNCSISYASLDRGSIRLWPEEGKFAGGPSLCILGTVATAASDRTRAHVREPAGAPGRHAQLLERAARLHRRHGAGAEDHVGPGRLPDAGWHPGAGLPRGPAATARMRRRGGTLNGASRVGSLERGLTPGGRRGLTPGRQRDQLVAVPLDAAGERQLDQGDLQGARRQACRPRQLVDVDRRRAERGQQAGAVLGSDLRQSSRGLGLDRSRTRRAPRWPAASPADSLAQHRARARR